MNWYNWTMAKSVVVFPSTFNPLLCREATRFDMELYCQNATDNQLQNILERETERAKRGGEVGETAAEFADEARKEMRNRQK